MRPFVDIVIETTNVTAMWGRLHSLGLGFDMAWFFDGRGIRLHGAELESVDGLFYLTFRIWEDRVHVIPKNNNPTFTILWRSDEYDEEGSLKPWPMVDCERWDEETQQMIQNQQGVGKIQ